MFLEEALKVIAECARRMDALYGGPVFDEWIMIQLGEKKSRILNYFGNRKESFQKTFTADLTSLHAELLSQKHSVGDFEFARHGGGTHFDAFVVAGEDIFLICNDTGKSMEEIARDPAWIEAQVPFVDLAEKFRRNPVFVPA